MTKEFESRVLRETIVDTRKYRYTARRTNMGIAIHRLPLNLLGTTRALHPWELVKIAKAEDLVRACAEALEDDESECIPFF